MLKRTSKNLILALVVGTPMVVASVPKSREISNDTSIYQNLREVRLSPVKHTALEARIDAGVEKPSATEKQHRTRVLPMRVSGPMDRVMKTPYSPSFKSHKRDRR